jgi:hypothetical protein
MNKLFASALIAAGLALSGVAAQAIPFGNDGTRDSLAVPVADGCGVNRYRDPRGVCRRKYVLGDHYGKRPLYGACGGLNSHRVCNFFGQCWMVCD